MRACIHTAVSFIRGWLTFWVILIAIGLILAAQSPPEHVPVPEQQRIEPQRAQERLASDYEEERRQEGFRRLGIK
jgi:hypothetical protein